MGRVSVAFRAFFAALFDGSASERLESALSDSGTEQPKLEAPKPAEKPKKDEPKRSEAVTLLATLQREARLVDLMMESLDGFSDAQVGAAARDVLRDSKQVLERCFQIEPLVDQEEESDLEVKDGYDVHSYRLTGNVGEALPAKGKLMHHGWKAQKVEVPKWQGSNSSLLVVAPAEVEMS